MLSLPSFHWRRFFQPREMTSNSQPVSTAFTSANRYSLLNSRRNHWERHPPGKKPELKSFLQILPDDRTVREISACSHGHSRCGVRNVANTPKPAAVPVKYLQTVMAAVGKNEERAAARVLFEFFGPPSPGAYRSPRACRRPQARRRPADCRQN